MSSTHYLRDLERSIAAGIERLPKRFRTRQSQYVLSAQNTDGGFSNREGGSDLYYTSFALRIMALLNVNQSEAWCSSAAYVRGSLRNVVDMVDCLSLLHARKLLDERGYGLWSNGAEWKALCKDILERYRASEGGYARKEGGPVSLYHTFLAGLCYEILDETMPETDRAVDIIRRRQRADGGFSDLGETTQGETSPTAAAVGLLRMFYALDQDVSRATADFIVNVQRPDGGFAAHDAAPVSDLLSTFTALVALSQLGALRRVELADVARFARETAARTGGFRGALLDDTPDVEYTYYGLATLGLLALEVACPCETSGAER